MNALIGVGLALFIFCFVMVVVSASEEEVMAKCSGTSYNQIAPDKGIADQSYTIWAYADLDRRCNKPDLHSSLEIFHNLLYVHVSEVQPGFVQISPPLTAPLTGYIQSEFRWECKSCGGQGGLTKEWQLQ